MTDVLFALMVRLFESLSWLPFLIGLIAALQAPLFALMVVQKPESPKGVDQGGSHSLPGRADNRH
jgi:hypothetical protein